MDTFPDHGVRVLYVLSTSQVLLVFPVTIVVFPLQQLCIRVFSTIINILLYEWADTHNKINKAQAGFRRGYSAIDKKNVCNLWCKSIYLGPVVDFILFMYNSKGVR